MPAPAFLVPSALEALREHPRYGAVTRVVPGEADGFVAMEVRMAGGAALSGDSDLLLHDLGPQGSLVLLSSVRRRPAAGSLSGLQFSPVGIAEALRLECLKPLAYAVLEDPHGGMKSILARARKVNTKDAVYRKFAQQYSDEIMMPPLDPEQLAEIAKLDPRVSEYVIPCLVALSATEAAQHNKGFTVYLPVLTEDPRKAPAWSYGKVIRWIAYSLLTPSTQKSTYVTYERYRNEHCHLGKVAVEHLHVDDVAKGLTWLWDRMSRVLLPNDADSGVELIEQQVLKWRALGVMFVFSGTQKDVPHDKELCALVGNSRGIRNWKDIHVGAQLQATLYSCRMLAQISKVHRTRKAREVMFKSSDTAYEAFDSMPRLDELSQEYKKSQQRDALIAALASRITRGLRQHSVEENPK